MAANRCVLALVVAVFAAGCDEDGGAVEMDARADAALEAGVDDPDAGFDAGEADAAVDAASDDGGEDAAFTEEDSGSGSGKRGTETELDAGVDAQVTPDATADATTEADAAQPEASTETGFPTLSNYIACNSDDDCPNAVDWQCVTQLALHHADLDGSNTLLISALDATFEGVCSRDCSRDATACDDLNLDAVEETAPFECQVVWVGDSPYPENLSPPFDDQLDAKEMEAGPAFAALCRPPLKFDPQRSASFCDACSDQNGCDDSSLCWDPLTDGVDPGNGTGTCVEACEVAADCPLGFECLDVGSAGTHCLPLADTCGDCRDLDQDGRGAGFCEYSATDCDDQVAKAYYDGSDMEHPFPAHCGDFDYNCNGVQDASELIEDYDRWGESHCGACGATCAGDVDNGVRSCLFDSDDGQIVCRAVCSDALSHADCDGNIDNGCEITVSGSDRIYYADADGDGYGDEAYPSFACTEGEAPSQTVKDDTDCDDTPGSGADIHPGATELCNLIDDDCDTSVDEGLATANHYLDADGDGQGQEGSSPLAECVWQGVGADPRGFALNSDDCDDGAKSTYKGADEYCDGDTLDAQVDSDCDGDLHDAPQDEMKLLYGDSDGDGRAGSATQYFCADVEGDAYYLRGDLYCSDGGMYEECETLAEDCGASNPDKWTDAPELCDGINNDCDGGTVDGLDVTVGDGTASSIVFGSSCGGLGLSGAIGACETGATWQCSGGPNLTCTAAAPTTDEAWEDDDGHNYDEDCDGYPGDDDRNVYVDIELGIDSTSAGSSSRPFQTVSYALQLFKNGLSAVAGKDTVVIAKGSYTHSKALVLEEGVNLVGGFIYDSSDHSWSKGGTTTLQRNWIEESGHVTGVTGSNLGTRTVLADLTVEVDSASATPGTGESGIDSRGVFLKGSAGAELRNVHVKVGDGVDGGGAADATSIAEAGRDGTVPIANLTICTFTYLDGGSYTSVPHDVTGGNGAYNGAGSNGKAVDADLAGTGGTSPGEPDASSGVRHTKASLAAYDASRGGAFGAAAGLTSSGLWSYSETLPTDGMPGGGGGGGFGYSAGAPAFWGGAGGGGGCGGERGANAGHGSNLFGVMIVDSDGLSLFEVTVHTGMAGHGGDGGNGARGGNGGQGATATSPAGDGGDGSGGSGGGGGAGGHGGHNMGVLVFGDDVCDGVGDVSCTGGVDKDGVPSDACVGSGGDKGTGGGRGSGGSGTAYTSGVTGSAGKDGRRELCLAMPDCSGGCASGSSCKTVSGAGSYCVPTR